MDQIFELKARSEELKNEVMNLALTAPSSDERKAHYLLAMELHDLNWAITNSIFKKNTETILKLISEIEKNTEDAKIVVDALNELTDAFKKARKIVTKLNNYGGKVGDTLDKVNGFLVDLKQPV